METQNPPLHFETGWASVTLSRDFYHNCITKDPFPHSHPIFELHYIDQGCCCVETKTENVLCQQGNFLLLPPRCIHRLLPMEEQVQTITLMFQLEDNYLPLGKLPSQEIWQFPDNFRGKDRLLCIREELTLYRPMYREKIQGELASLLADIFRVLGESKTTSEETGDNRADQIQGYLMEHRFDPDCSCENLANKLHLSTRQVQRLCLQYYGATFRQMLTSMRMEIAAYRLRTTDVPIGELAQQMGYSSAAYFSAAYKHHFGIAPSQDRVLDNRT